MLRRIHQPTFAELYAPKVITVLREGYGLADFRADAIAGLTGRHRCVAVVDGDCDASGVTPDRGLYTAVVGGFHRVAAGRQPVSDRRARWRVHRAGGVDRRTPWRRRRDSRHRDGRGILDCGGSAAAWHLHQIHSLSGDGGIYRRYRRHHLRSQLKDLFGITLSGKEPGEFIPKLEALAGGLHTAQGPAIALAGASILIIVVLRRLRPHWPGILIAVALAALATWVLSIPVETIGTRFGGIPRQLPSPAWPSFSLAKAQAVLPDAIAFALLGAIESLLSAVVADGMTGAGIAPIANWWRRDLPMSARRCRRHLCHRHHRANRDQRPRWRARPDLRHVAFGVPVACSC